MPRIEKLINKYKDEKKELNNVVKKMASNSGTKDFKKRNWENIIPNMTCDANLVKTFRIEAEEKQWSYTTLMNNILKYKYTTIEPELPLIPTENYPSNYSNVNIIKHINLNEFNEEEKYLVADYIFKDFQEIFNSYDYVLIDYPPTMQELALNFLIISDLVVIPINNGIGSYKGLLDLKNSLNHICRKENREVPKLKIILNNVKEDEDIILIYKTLEKENLTHFLSKNFINHSRSFVKSENDLSSIWTNPYYWRQKQAYEELIAEIL